MHDKNIEYIYILLDQGFMYINLYEHFPPRIKLKFRACWIYTSCPFHVYFI